MNNDNMVKMTGGDRGPNFFLPMRESYAQNESRVKGRVSELCHLHPCWGRTMEWSDCEYMWTVGHHI